MAVENYSLEQATHDEINLVRLVRRLEKSVASESDWDDAADSQRDKVWLQALGTLQKVKHAQKLMRKLERYDSTPPPKKARQRTEIKSSLERIHIFVTKIHDRTKPAQQRPEPILPRIPVPQSPESDSQSASSATVSITTEKEDPLTDKINEQPQERIERPETSFAKDDHPPSLLPPPTSSSFTPRSPLSSLLPATPTTGLSSNTNNLSLRKPFNSSMALHDELTLQLSQMATQLKHNAQHFSASLERDKAVISGTDEKLQVNYDAMTREKGRLRDFVSGKNSRGLGVFGRISTTWLVLGIVVLVLLIFVVMVGVIRFSRR